MSRTEVLDNARLNTTPDSSTRQQYDENRYEKQIFLGRIASLLTTMILPYMIFQDLHIVGTPRTGVLFRIVPFVLFVLFLALSFSSLKKYKTMMLVVYQLAVMSLIGMMFGLLAHRMRLGDIGVYMISVSGIIVVIVTVPLFVIGGIKRLLPIYLVPSLGFIIYLMVSGGAPRQYLVELSNPLLMMIICLFAAEGIERLRCREFAVNKMVKIKNEELQEKNKTIAAMHDELWGEMQLARKLQTVLLPKHPTLKGYKISAYMKPADQVGGDYYDIINAHGIDWIVIADVAGHGVSAGIVMMMVQTATHTVAHQIGRLSPAALLTAINKIIYENILQLGEQKYISMTVLGAVEPGKMVFSGLHQDILIYRSSTKDVERVLTNGMWVGVVEDISGMVQNNIITFEKGDSVVLFTDGITEAWKKEDSSDENQYGEMFGRDNLIKAIKRAGDGPPEEIKNAILDDLSDYQCIDDVTMLIMQRV